MWNIGDRVLAWWPAEMLWWYAGTIISIESNGLFLVSYDDGDRAFVYPEAISPLNLRQGTSVFGRFQGGDRYYPGVLTQIKGSAIFIEYVDGDVEWTTAAVIRIALPPPVKSGVQ